MTVNVIAGDHALLRKESFGGTLFFVKKGRRAYIDRKEFAAINYSGLLTLGLADELSEPVIPIKTVVPDMLPEQNFSAPDTVFLEVTRACNLTCTHCFNDSGTQLPDQLSITQLEQAVDNLAVSGVQEIRFTGGEPLALPGIISLVHRASSFGLRCSMGTNAALITERKADDLKDAGLRAGIVSLDGLEDRHDRIRGHGSFRLAIKGIERLRTRGIDVRVNMVVMRSNLNDLIPLVEMLVERGVPMFMRRLILSGRAKGSSSEMLSQTEYAALRARLRYHLEDQSNLVDGHYLREKKFSSRIALPFPRKECSAGHRGLVMLPNGKVQTCGFLGPLGETSIGVLPSETLATIWARLNGSGHIQDFEGNIEPYNRATSGPKTNCLAIALAGQEPLIQIKRKEKVS